MSPPTGLQRRVLAACAVALLAFGGGRLLGGGIASRVADTPKLDVTHAVMTGSLIPEGVLQSADNRPVAVRALARRASTPLVLVAMTEGCQSCTDDSPRWEAVAATTGSRVRFVQLVCAADFEQAARTPPIEGFGARYLCDDVLRKSWNLSRLPAAIVLDSAGRVEFVDMGGPVARVTADYLASRPTR